MTPAARFPAVVAALLGAAILVASPTRADDMQAQLQSLLDGFRADFGFPGATAAIALPDGNVVTAATGSADVQSGVPLTPDNRMLAASMPEPYLDRLLDGVPVAPDAPGILYGAGVAVYSETPRGPVWGHGGWIPGYVSSLRHYAEHVVTVAFQVNTDVGILDDSTDLVPVLEAALADLAIGAANDPDRP